MINNNDTAAVADVTENRRATERRAKKIIEAVLFAAGHPVSYAKLAAVLDITPAEVMHLVREYAEEYNDDRGALPRGITMLLFDDSCQICTKEEFGPYIREALGIHRGGNLSPSSIEVLAIIAYNEPVTRAFVDTVRGVDSSYAISSLSDKHLIESCGRLDVPGRPMLYKTTTDFLRVFGLKSLSDLPMISVAVSDLKERFENNSIAESEAINAGEDEAEMKTEAT